LAFYVFSVVSSMLFYSSMLRYIFCVPVLFSVLLCSFSVLLYSSVLLCCSSLFILLCSSSYYVCVHDCIYCTLTVTPGVNPIAVNKYLSKERVELYLDTRSGLSWSVLGLAFYSYMYSP
jgi:hypothetical protein